jgi:hypothetical protein
VAHEYEAECLELREERVLAVQDVVGTENDARGRRVFERAVQGETLQAVCVRDAREDDVRDARVDEVKVREVLDRDALEGAVPGVVPR